MLKKITVALVIVLLPTLTHAADLKDPFADVNMKMHHAMMVQPTGDTDVDFVRGMIPHHQGAVDMAEIELKQGKDPEIRKLARDIIAAQKKEIAQMNKWLEKNAQTRAPDTKHHH